MKKVIKFSLLSCLVFSIQSAEYQKFNLSDDVASALNVEKSVTFFQLLKLSPIDSSDYEIETAVSELKRRWNNDVPDCNHALAKNVIDQIKPITDAALNFLQRRDCF